MNFWAWSFDISNSWNPNFKFQVAVKILNFFLKNRSPRPVYSNSDRTSNCSSRLYFSHDIVGNIVGVKFDIDIDIVNIEIVADFVVVVAEVIVLLNIVD